MNEINKILIDLINEKNSQLNNYLKKENYNKNFAEQLKSELVRLNFINDYFINSQNKKIDKTINNLNNLIDKQKKFELICLIHGIDNINYFLSYSIADLIEMLKDFRSNKMVRIPITLNCNNKIYKSEICNKTNKYILKKS
jgi:hypothetical protein